MLLQFINEVEYRAPYKQNKLIHFEEFKLQNNFNRGGQCHSNKTYLDIDEQRIAEEYSKLDLGKSFRNHIETFAMEVQKAVTKARDMIKNGTRRSEPQRMNLIS